MGTYSVSFAKRKVVLSEVLEKEHKEHKKSGWTEQGRRKKSDHTWLWSVTFSKNTSLRSQWNLREDFLHSELPFGSQSHLSSLKSFEILLLPQPHLAGVPLFQAGGGRVLKV